MAQIDSYDATAAARTATREFRITFAYGQGNTVVMHWSIADLEAALRMGEIKPDAFCVQCGEHVTECLEVGHLLIEWPERLYSTTWSEPATAHKLGLLLFS